MVNLDPGTNPPRIGRIHRRRFLITVSRAFVALGLTGPAGCVEEELGAPDSEGYTVWVARSVSGTVRHALTGDPIAGASVVLRAGFDPDNLFLISQQKKITSQEGGFSFVRAEETGTAGDFWWFLVPDTRPREVWIQLEVRHKDFYPVWPQKTLTRQPSKEEPTRRLDIYHLGFSVSMNRADEG